MRDARHSAALILAAIGWAFAAGLVLASFIPGVGRALITLIWLASS